MIDYKKILFIVPIGLFLVFFIYYLFESGLARSLYDSSKNLVVYGGNQERYSCKKTGGSWEYYGCGSACGKNTPITKADRIYDEGTLEYTNPFLNSCIKVCTQGHYCVCNNGEYYGSIEEGCIPISQKAKPSEEEKRKYEEAKKKDRELRSKTNRGIR